MTATDQLSTWQRWVKRPQKIWLRRATFQIHLWSGVILGLYILMMSVTGSIVEYSNELYRYATPKAIISTSTAPRLTDDELTAAVLRVYPGFTVTNLGRASNSDQAVDVYLRHGNDLRRRFFDPRSGVDLGDSIPFQIRAVSWLLDLHDNLLAGSRGRKINGAGAVALILVAISGLVIWWPGSKTWKRSLILPRRVGWKRSIWHLHSMIGFWSLAFTLVFGLSGIYLCYPEPIMDFAERLEAPATPATAGLRLGDRIIYWLAYLHFGRINGIGIPCKGPGVCDQATKFAWALFGFAPAIMFVTGAVIWWNRVLRPRMKRAE